MNKFVFGITFILYVLFIDYVTSMLIFDFRKYIKKRMIKDRNKGLRVLDYIDENEILAQLSEEASEVAKAALKLRRARDRKNPTPVSIREAWADLNEEYGDVLNCLYALFNDDDDRIYDFFEHANITADEKRKRWIKRLKERDQF